MKITSNKIIDKLLFALLISIISIIFAYLFYLTDPYKRLQNSIYDIIFNLKKTDKSITNDIAIVAIDENSLLRFQNEKGIAWPWPRNVYAIISDYIINDGAKGVVYDILFSTPDFDRDNIEGSGYQNDELFYSKIIETNKIILSYNIDKNWGTRKNIDTIDIKDIKEIKNINEYKYVIPPFDMFMYKNKNYGFVDTKGDSDGIIREYTPLAKIDNNYHPSLALATYLITQNDRLPENLSLNKNGNIRLNWYGKGGNKGIFKYYSVIDIINSWIKKNKGDKPVIPENTFKNKIVFIGSSARGLMDMKSTPFTKEQAYPGVEIHATAFLNLINKDWIKSISVYLELLIYLIILSLLIFFGIDSKSPIRYTILYFVFIIIVCSIHLSMFLFYNYMFQTALFITLIFIGYLLTQVTNYIQVGHTRNVIKNAFSKYLSSDLLKKAIDSGRPLTTSGENIEASVMFIDIAGFTTFSEKNSVEKVVDTLNLYLKKFSECILSNKGFINKFLGDGLMALFGAPQPFNDHADMVLKSAFECYKINKELQAEYGLNVRIGVNSGRMIAGNLGGGGKFEYTSIGDCVNTASRLEGANKFFNTNICIGENTIKLIKNTYEINYLGKISLKGKDIPYGVYYYNEAPKNTKEAFNKMLSVYESGDEKTFIKYVNLFEKKEFGPAMFYINYYRRYKNKFGHPIKLTEK